MNKKVDLKKLILIEEIYGFESCILLTTPPDAKVIPVTYVAGVGLNPKPLWNIFIQRIISQYTIRLTKKQNLDEHTSVHTQD